MLKKILFLICLFLWISISFWTDTDYYEYAEIPWTDIIEFNTQNNNKIYEVKVETGNIENVTWSDGKLHACFPIVWTWYTEKLGEIYFQYEWTWSYICSDNKLRWYFKIWAWGRGNMEDLENNPEKWKLFVSKNPDTNDWYYYHGEDENWNWTGQSRLDGIWFANWNNANIRFNIGEDFSNINAQVTFNANWEVANWYNTWEITITLRYKKNWELMTNFKVDSIGFITWYNSDVLKNWTKIPWYKYTWPLTTDNNWQIIWQAKSYVGWNRIYWIKIKIWNNEIIKTWSVVSKYPFELNLDITWDEIAWKTVIWYNNKVKIITSSVNSNITNLNFNNITWALDLWTYKNYFTIENWEKIYGINNSNDLKIIWDLNWWFYSWDDLNLSYDVTWTYNYKIWSDTYKINNFIKSTNPEKIYKYWKIDHISITNTNSLNSANWKNILWYDLKFYNKNNYPINNLSFDLNNFQDPDKKFDLDDSTSGYETWFFITWDKSFSDVNWVYKVWVVSYKPVNWTVLTWMIENIQYTWNSHTSSPNTWIKLTNISFVSPVWMNFENKVLKANIKDNFKVSYTKDQDNVSNPSYGFTWYIRWCSDCVFSWDLWRYIKDNDFNNKTYDVYISWSHAPDAIIYTWYYSYNLNGNYGNNLVKNYFEKEYSPIIYVNKWAIKLVWIAWSNNKILWWINYISTSAPVYIMKNIIKKHVIKSSIWYKKENINSDKDIDLSNIGKINIYNCPNWWYLNITNWNYTWDKEIISLWCEINIKNNIIWHNGHLKIFSYKEDNNYNFSEINWWKNKWNIYIKENINTVQASLYTNGSIFTYVNDINNWILTWRTQAWFKKQLYIYWKVFSANTFWWWTQDKNLKFTILWWRKINNNDNIFWVDGYMVAQAYDINFWRTSLLNSDEKTYSTWDISDIIYNKYHCSWNKDNDSNDICSASIIIEDPNIKK